jgi:ribosome-associated protein
VSVDEEVRQNLRVAAQAALARKAFQLAVLDVTELTSLADSFLICSGAHERQVGAIADAVERKLKGEGRRPLHVEGRPACEWVLLDYGDLIIHVFTEERRAFYGLDGLWGGARMMADELDLEELDAGP